MFKVQRFGQPESLFDTLEQLMEWIYFSSDFRVLSLEAWKERTMLLYSLTPDAPFHIVYNWLLDFSEEMQILIVKGVEVVQPPQEEPYAKLPK